MSENPCIRVTPKDPTKPAFTLCGRVTESSVAIGEIMHLPDAAVQSWCCRACSRRYKRPAFRTVTIPRERKPFDERSIRRSHSPSAKRQAKIEARNAARKAAIGLITDL